MTIHLRNIGDGPAQNVTLTFTAATRLEWNKDGLAVDRNERKEQTISKAGERVSSFMRVGDLSGSTGHSTRTRSSLKHMRAL